MQKVLQSEVCKKSAILQLRSAKSEVCKASPDNRKEKSLQLEEKAKLKLIKYYQNLTKITKIVYFAKNWLMSETICQKFQNIAKIEYQPSLNYSPCIGLSSYNC